MRAGRLSHRLKLQQETATQDSLGGAIISWTTVATVWGAVEAFTGKEFFAGGKVSGELMVRIIIRYGAAWSAIDNKWRIEDANTGLKYDIKTAIHAETTNKANEKIQLMCTTGTTDQ